MGPTEYDVWNATQGSFDEEVRRVLLLIARAVDRLSDKIER